MEPKPPADDRAVDDTIKALEAQLTNVWPGCTGLRYGWCIRRWRNGSVQHKLYLVSPCD